MSMIIFYKHMGGFLHFSLVIEDKCSKGRIILDDEKREDSQDDGDHE